MNAKFIASGAGFIALGAILGWAVTADLNEEKIRNLTEENEELVGALRSSQREAIRLRLDNSDQKEIISKFEDALDKETGFADDENSAGGTSEEIVLVEEIENVNYDEIPIVPEGETVEETRANLQQMISQYTNSEDDQEIFVRRAENVVVATKYDPPFVISQEKYAWDEEGEGDDYAKQTFRYYPRQQVLLDEDSEPVDDVDAYVGWRNLRRFGDESGDANVVFVRNRRLEMDIEVELVEDEDLPLHVKYAMPKVEFESQKAMGKIQMSED